ncbi:putative membrane protein SpoIIM required for sporulation [Flavobacterium cutihirudinis]|uniref:Putative membrane protein SpoIIM required for sporulation n=1 Tax=Flavobacterium cutihirudinis TaxID=1265740 RepID=A0A3D9FZG4_9FLAO|nr:stage II sporulation protein M [Flavobacterium cutihirudinis]RED26263.1 putative membrane protein SpoIIM required for sporulation [Flavobacterium cutihirudinis]
MREIAFIKQNKEKWLEFELAIFGKAKKNPDELANLYIQMMNDLSYAQTYYPKSKTVIYLNHLASQIYQKIYKTKRTEKNRIVEFFLTEIPLLVYEYKRYLLYSFILFVATVAIGVVSAKYDPNFVRLILGDEYVNMTLENIKKGNPMAVYGSGSNWGSFIAITMNNLYVGAKCYFFGIFAGIGTFFIFLNNCIMLGSFQYFFYEEGVFWKSVRGIWIHGSMEIFAIVIETAAGFILGASMLFPKTFSRLNSFKIGFKNSFKIFLSTFPFTISAGFLEGFITRYSIDMPNWLSSFIILLTLGIISFYYLIYPFIVNKKVQQLSAKLN